jgi:hypothetical protein
MKFLVAVAPPRFLHRRPPSLPGSLPPHWHGSRFLTVEGRTLAVVLYADQHPLPLWPATGQRPGGDGRSSTARLQRRRGLLCSSARRMVVEKAGPALM